MWQRKALEANFEGEGLHALLELLRVVAYNMSNGPWRGLWVRYGYDPGQDPVARLYQVIDVRWTEAGLQKLKRWVGGWGWMDGSTCGLMSDGGAVCVWSCDGMSVCLTDMVFKHTQRLPRRVLQVAAAAGGGGRPAAAAAAGGEARRGGGGGGHERAAALGLPAPPADGAWWLANVLTAFADCLPA